MPPVSVVRTRWGFFDLISTISTSLYIKVTWMCNVLKALYTAEDSTQSSAAYLVVFRFAESGATAKRSGISGWQSQALLIFWWARSVQTGSLLHLEMLDGTHLIQLHLSWPALSMGVKMLSWFASFSHDSNLLQILSGIYCKSAVTTLMLRNWEYECHSLHSLPLLEYTRLKVLCIHSCATSRW